MSGSSKRSYFSADPPMGVLVQGGAVVMAVTLTKGNLNLWLHSDITEAQEEETAQVMMEHWHVR